MKIISFFIFASTILACNSQNSKPIYNDTLIANSNSYYSLCFEKIKCEFGEIHISMKINPAKIDYFNCYKFVINKM